MLSVDLGFDGERVAVTTLQPSADAYPGADELNGFFDEVEAVVAALPGVLAVGTASHLPLNHETSPIRYAGGTVTAGPIDDWPSALTSRVDGSYFDAMGIELVAGRVFQPEDYEADIAVVISRSMAERLFPEGAVGRALQWGRAGTAYSATVVGVVGDVRYEDLTSPERPHLYRPLEGSATRRRFVLARTDGEPTALTGAIRGAVSGVDADIPPEIRVYDEIVLESTLLWTMSSIFLGVFGVVAILLASLGIYGLMAFSVSQRRRELGLRMALGADGALIQKSVVLGGLKLTGIGLGAGIGLALLTAFAARSFLYGVAVLDPVTLGGVVTLFAVVGVTAAFVPARRAARVDPLHVLRAE